MGILLILPAGFATWTGRGFRSSDSIVHTSHAGSVGSRTRVCPCAPAMEEPITRMAHAPLALQNVDCSNTTSKSTAESCSFKPARCPHRGRPLISSEEYIHALDSIYRRMVGRAFADCTRHPRDCGP